MTTRGDLELGHAHIDRSSLQAVMESVSLSKLAHYGGVPGIIPVSCYVLLSAANNLLGVVKGVNSSMEHGLSKHEMDTNFVERRREYGENILPEMKHKSFLKLFVESLRDPIIIILIVAAVISISLQSAFHDPSHAWYEGR
jgi:magnesium-transporting ATPase (P-type)